MFKGSHTGSLPGASLVFFSMNLWTSSRPFPELPLEGRDRKLLAASNNISTSGSWEAAYLLLYQIQTTEGCLPYAQDGITCNHLDHGFLLQTLVLNLTALGCIAFSSCSHFWNIESFWVVNLFVVSVTHVQHLWAQFFAYRYAETHR